MAAHSRGDGRPQWRLPAAAFLPFLGGAFLLAAAYGASFMLPDALRAAGSPPTDAGTMIGGGTLATLAGSLVAGRVVQRAGLMPTIVAAAVIMALALACFTAVGTAGTWTGYLGGLLLGLGWALAYILMPIQLIQHLGAAVRLEALMVLSGSQMVGIGLSAPIGRVLARWCGGVEPALAVYAALCGAAVLLLSVSMRAFRAIPRQPVAAVTLSLSAVRAILGGRTALPVAMIGLAACSFSGLSVFQSLLAEAHDVSPDAFFLVFTATTVTLRFSVASRIGRLPLERLALALALAMLLGLIGFAAIGSNLAAWIGATLVFSVGYGLNYATLNARVVNLADARGIALPVASQVFTVGYFVGLFGFPPVATRAVAAAGVGSIIATLVAVAFVNVGLALALCFGSSPRCTER